MSERPFISVAQPRSTLTPALIVMTIWHAYLLCKKKQMSSTKNWFWYLASTNHSVSKEVKCSAQCWNNENIEFNRKLSVNDSGKYIFQVLQQWESVLPWFIGHDLYLSFTHASECNVFSGGDLVSYSQSY